MKLSICVHGIVIALVSLGHMTNGYNVLLLLTSGTKSHKIVFDSVAQQLLKRGHNITIVSSVKADDDFQGITNVYGDQLDRQLADPDMTYFQPMRVRLRILPRIFSRFCNNFYNISFIVDLIRNPMNSSTQKPKFDVVVVDLVNMEFALPIAHHLNVPSVFLSTMYIFNHHAWPLDIPFPYSYIPTGLVMDINNRMSLIDRAINCLLGLTSHLVFPRYNDCDERIERMLPNSPPIKHLFHNVSFVIANSHLSKEVVAPAMPFYVELGCLHCRQAQPLNRSLEEFMRSGIDGVIYFSLGSLTKGHQMPDQMKNKMIEAFSKLPQKILWKYENDIPNLPNNVQLIKWAPQQDILGHPQLRLFIGHGGGQSIGEATYHGCPVLCFPLGADQLRNVILARRAGFAEHLDWEQFTVQQLVDLINRMLNDNTYKERAVFASVLMRDRVESPVETAAYWIEYVVRHGGAPFLKTSGSHLYTFQYFLVDVMAVIAAILLVAGLISRLIIKLVIKCFVKSIHYLKRIVAG